MEYMERRGRQRTAGKRAGSRPERSEGIIAAATLALVLLIAFLINSFFYGFDTPQRTVSAHEEIGVIRTSIAGGRSLTIEEDAGKEEEQLPQEWNLQLVNSTHPLAEGTAVPKMTVLRRGEQVDSRIYPALQKMFDDMRAQGLKPIVADGYHSAEEHEKLLEDLAKEYQQSGETAQRARSLAELAIGAVGANEHELGICADITSEKGDAVSERAVLSWLQEHSWEYGFILRYPQEAVQVTGISGTPQHYRFVGHDAARTIYEQGLTLEEYLTILSRK